MVLEAKKSDCSVGMGSQLRRRSSKKVAVMFPSNRFLLQRSRFSLHRSRPTQAKMTLSPGQDPPVDDIVAQVIMGLLIESVIEFRVPYAH